MIKVKTTKADYDAAMKVCTILPWLHASSTCLLAQAIKRVTGRPCSVGSSGVMFKDNNELFSLPVAAQDAVYLFDHKRHFSEIEFELTPVKPAVKAVVK